MISQVAKMSVSFVESKSFFDFEANNEFTISASLRFVHACGLGWFGILPRPSR